MATEPTLRQITAIHEAGHAVMRHMRGLLPTDIKVGDGDGFCAPSGELISAEDDLLVALGGPAAELIYLHWENETDAIESGFSNEQDLPGFLALNVDFNATKSVDLEHARRAIEADYLRIRLPDNWQTIPTGTPIPTTFYSVNDALKNWFMRCCNELLQDWQLVESVAAASMDGNLSASALQTAIDEYWQHKNND